MFGNENKGNFGMFSRAGVQTTEKYHILMKKDEILNPTNKRFISKTLFENKPVVVNKNNINHILNNIRILKRMSKKKLIFLHKQWLK